MADVTGAQATQLRQIQLGAANLVREELTVFFGSLNLDKPEQVRDALLQYVPLLVQRYGAGSAAVAADWYDDVRSGMNVRGKFRARVGDPVDVARVDRAVRFAAQHLFTATPALTLAAIAAPVARYVMEPSRMTIIASTQKDPASKGWQRRTKGDACAFCKALAARGAVYVNHSADFGAHNDCGCVAVPSWSPNAREVPVQVYEASRRTAGMTDAEKARHLAKVHLVIAKHEAGDEGY